MGKGAEGGGGIGRFSPRFSLMILSRFLSEERAKQRKKFPPHIFSKDFFKIFSEDFKNLSNNQDENLHENILRKIRARFSRKFLQKSGENLRKKSGENL